MHLQKRSWSYGTRVLLAVADVVGATLRDLRLHLHMWSALGYIAEATRRRKYDHIKGLRLEEKNNRTIHNNPIAASDSLCGQLSTKFQAGPNM